MPCLTVNTKKPTSETILLGIRIFLHTERPQGCVCVCGGDTLIFSYKRRLGPFFGFKILNFNIFVFFRKINILGGKKILWIFLGGHHKIGLYLGVISMHFRVFS